MIVPLIRFLFFGAGQAKARCPYQDTTAPAFFQERVKDSGALFPEGAAICQVCFEIRSIKNEEIVTVTSEHAILRSGI